MNPVRVFEGLLWRSRYVVITAVRGRSGEG